MKESTLQCRTICLFLVSLLSIAVAGCGGNSRTVVAADTTAGNTGGNNTGGSQPQGKLYVANIGANSILRYDNALTINGDVAPSAVISGDATQLSEPRELAFDEQSDRLLVANQNANSILIFEKVSQKSGNVPPDRVITGPATLLQAPANLVLDKSRDLLYVANIGRNIVDVFSSISTVNGNSAPIHSFFVAGTNPKGHDGASFIQSPILPLPILGISLDSSNDRLYIAVEDSGLEALGKLENASTLNGAVDLSTNIQGPNTELGNVLALFLDPSDNLIVSNTPSGSAGSSSVLFYKGAGTANGNVAPSVTIKGPTTQLNLPVQTTFNSSSGDLFVADAGGAVLIFRNPATSNGNVAPTRSISGPKTGLNVSATSKVTAVGLALDTTR